MAVVYNNAEGGVNGAAVTVDNSAGASGYNLDSVTLGSGTAITYTNTPARGNLSYQFTYGATAATATIGWSISSGVSFLKTATAAYVRLYFYLPTLPSTAARLFTISGSVNVEISPAGKISAHDAAGTSPGLSTTTVPTGQWVRLELKCIPSSTVGQIEWKVFYDADSPYHSEKLTSAATMNTGSAFAAALTCGQVVATANYTYYLDSIAVSDSGYLGPADPSPVSTYDRYADAESGTDGTVVTAGNAVASLGNALETVTAGGVTFSSAQKAHGNLSYLIQPTSGSADVMWWSNFSSTQATVRLYVYFTAFPPSGSASEFAQFLITPLSFAQLARLIINPTGQVQVYDTSGSIWTSTNAISTNTWYRFELSAALGGSATTGTINAAFYSGDSVTAIETFSTSAANLGTANIASFRLGRINANTWVDPIYYDDVAIQAGTTTFIGPYTPPLAQVAYPGVTPFSGWGTQL